jgi:hypothetical protein
MATTVHWSNNVFNDVPDDATIDDIKDTLAGMYPAVANAQARTETVDGDRHVYLEVRSGSKG